MIDDKNQKNTYNIMKMTGRATVISVMVMMPLIAIIGIYCCDFQCNWTLDNIFYVEAVHVQGAGLYKVLHWPEFFAEAREDRSRSWFLCK